jgi:diguanylate cyclase (GGDEF)-like protein
MYSNLPMGIRGKLILPILFAFIGFAAILHYYWAPLQVNHGRNIFMQQAGKELTAMESGLIRNLLTRDYSALFATLDAQSKLHKDNWSQLRLYNEDSKKIYPLYEKSLDKMDHSFHIPYRHELKLNGDTLGYIDLHLNWQHEYESTNQRILQLELFLILTAFLLSVLLLAWQHKSVISPINKLQEMAERMARGDFSISLPEAGNDEVGHLTSTFDLMRREIMSYQQSLETAHRETKKALSAVAQKNVELEKEINRRKKVEEQLATMAMYDSLTTLPNRRLLIKEAEKLIAAARRTGKHTVFMFIDLDGFKAVNDQHGHDTGDKVLTEMAGRLRNSVREIDTVGRFGGDEFVVVLPECNIDGELKSICTRIIKEIGKPLTMIDGDEVIGASIGIAIYPDDAKDVQDLISLADQAMYIAKQSGGNQYTFISMRDKINSNSYKSA